MKAATGYDVLNDYSGWQRVGLGALGTIQSVANFLPLVNVSGKAAQYVAQGALLRLSVELTDLSVPAIMGLDSFAPVIDPIATVLTEPLVPIGVAPLLNVALATDGTLLSSASRVSSANPTVLAPRVGPAMIVPGSLPAEEEAALLQTLEHIDAGTVPSGPTATRWGIPFENRAGDLPGGSYASSPYTEYRVAPPAGTTGGGVRRIVVDNQTGAVYYTWTHYGTAGNPPFVTIRGPRVP